MSEPYPIGTHLVSPRRLHPTIPMLQYTHHGLYAGCGRVVHYAGWSKPGQPGIIEEVSLEDFEAGYKASPRDHPEARFTGEQAVARARSRIGEDAYSVFANNCEHFVVWAITGEHDSRQVDLGAAVGTPVGGTLVGMVGKTAAAAGGTAMGLAGAAGTMKALAIVGGTVGGGAVAGIAVAGTALGAGSAKIVNSTLLATREGQETEEAEAREFGRKASYVGAATGVVGGVAAVGATGVTGFSAVGITTGLAGIGGVIGGGMGAGLAITLAAPVVAAAAVGYGSYKLVRHMKRKTEEDSTASEGETAVTASPAPEKPKV